VANDASGTRASEHRIFTWFGRSNGRLERAANIDLRLTRGRLRGSLLDVLRCAAFHLASRYLEESQTMLDQSKTAELSLTVEHCQRHTRYSTRRWFKLISIVCAAFALTYCGIHYGLKLVVRSGGAKLVVSNEDLEIGDVLIQRDFRWTVNIENPNPVDVEVTHVQASCNCAAVTPRSFKLLAGEALPLTLSIALASQSLSATSATASPIPFRLALAALSGDPPLPRLECELRGRVRIPVRFERKSIDSPYPVTRIIGASVEDVSTLYVAERPGYLQATVENSRSGWNVSVQPLKETPQSFTSVVWLAGGLATGERFSGLPIQVTGCLVHDGDITESCG
jgi:hypothetical protein